MKTYNEFKPALVESNHVGTVPKFRKNILAFSMIGILAIGTIAGSLFYTSYKTSKIEGEYQTILEVTQSNNELISQNLSEIERLMAIYPEDDRKAFTNVLMVQGVNPVALVSAEDAYSLNEEARQKFEEAIEFIENSPFRHVNVRKQDPNKVVLNGKSYEPKEFQKFVEAQETPAPIRFKSDVLLHYKNLADESLNLSFLSAEYSEIALNEVKEASAYLEKYNNFISNIEKTMKLDGYKEEEIEKIVNDFKSAVTARAFMPQFEVGKNNRPITSENDKNNLMSGNFDLAKQNHDKIIAYLDEKRPKPKPIAEVKEVELPKSEEVKPKAVELPKEEVKEVTKPATPKPRQQQAPRRQQNSVPSW